MDSDTSPVERVCQSLRDSDTESLVQHLSDSDTISADVARILLALRGEEPEEILSSNTNASVQKRYRIVG